MLKSQLKDVPEAQQEQILKAVEKNPELFKTIAKEVQQEIKNGKDQMTATMEVMQKYQSELQKAMQ